MRTVLAAFGTLVVLAAAGTLTASATPTGDSPESSSMILVLDASGSMSEPTGSGGKRIDAARKGLNAVIDGLPEEQSVGFRVYGATDLREDDPKACKDSQLIVPIATDNRDDLRKAVKGYKPVGWTPTSHALKEAAKDLPDEGQRTIVLVSDGEPTCDPDPCEVADEIAKKGIDLRIDVVGFHVDGKARKTLQCVAEAGNGSYFDADDAASLNDALTVTATRSARPFDLAGTPIDGTPEPEGAPDISMGQYLDTIPEEGQKNYALRRTAPGSTFHLGAVLRGEAGDLGAAATMFVNGAEGTGCNNGNTYGLRMSNRNPIYYGGLTSWNRQAKPECNEDSDLTFSISRTVGKLRGQPVELAVYEEPPITSAVSEENVPDEPTWSTLNPGAPVQNTVPGTSLANAPILEPGSYDFDITAGETQVVGVPVDWGQNVQAQVDATLNDEVRKAAAAGSGVDLSIINPLRAQVPIDLNLSKTPKDWETDPLANIRENSTFRTGAMSWTVHPENRAVVGSVRQQTSAIAGIHYVMVGLSVRGDEANLPYTLTVKTNQAVKDAAPTYAKVEGLTPPTADSRLVGASATSSKGSADSKDATEPADKDDDSGFPWWIVAAAGAGFLAIGIAGVVISQRRQKN